MKKIISNLLVVALLIGSLLGCLSACDTAGNTDETTNTVFNSKADISVGLAVTVEVCVFHGETGLSAGTSFSRILLQKHNLLRFVHNFSFNNTRCNHLHFLIFRSACLTSVEPYAKLLPRSVLV